MTKQITSRIMLLIVLVIIIVGSGFKERAVISKAIEQEEDTKVINLVAVGDIVMHLPIVASAYSTTGGYDFRPILGNLYQDLTNADLAVTVLETQLSGPEKPYTGYPQFNSPYQIGDALQWAGVDLVFTAHNHALDQGTVGLSKTLTYLDKIGLSYIGCRHNPTQKRFVIKEVKGLRLAFLSYTTTTNGIPIPPGKEWMINLFDFEKINEDIRAAREGGADGIILALHSGVEYQREPSWEQQQLCYRLLEAGVDIILGSHVHVIQPLESRLVVTTGNQRKRCCFIAYSLGNFLSNQYWRYSDCGLLVSLKLAKSGAAPGMTIQAVNYNPIWVDRFNHQGRPHYRIWKITDATLASADPDLIAVDHRRMREVAGETSELLRNWFQKKAATSCLGITDD